METYLIYYEYFLKIIVYVYMWYLGHIIGKQQILICSKVVVKSNCTVYSVQWLNTWVTHTHNTHTQADTLTHWDSLFDKPQTSLYLNIWFKIQPLEKANIIDLQYLKKIFGRLYTALCICGLLSIYLLLLSWFSTQLGRAWLDVNVERKYLFCAESTGRNT